MNTKITLAIAVTAVMVAVAVAPLASSPAFARSLSTCNGSPGSCPGNSGSNGNDNKCETTYTGNSANSKVKSSSC
jgi:hypothetical protein